MSRINIAIIGSAIARAGSCMACSITGITEELAAQAVEDFIKFR
jgi:hypothetical protein